MRTADYPGTFIVIEGSDGSGTTTQSERLADKFNAYWTKEPTDNQVGRKIDDMISSDSYSAEAIALAFAADRMLHLEDEVLPRLEDGETVISDRYYHSSLAYQPALGASLDWVKKLNEHAVTPDLTVFIVTPVEEAMKRILKRSGITPHLDVFTEDDETSLEEVLDELDAYEGGENIFENVGFQEQVVLRYRRLAEELGEDVVVVDGSKEKDEVFEQIMDALREHGLVEEL